MWMPIADKRLQQWYLRTGCGKSLKIIQFLFLGAEIMDDGLDTRVTQAPLDVVVDDSGGVFEWSSFTVRVSGTSPPWLTPPLFVTFCTRAGPLLDRFSPGYTGLFIWAIIRPILSGLHGRTWVWIEVIKYGGNAHSRTGATAVRTLHLPCFENTSLFPFIDLWPGCRKRLWLVTTEWLMDGRWWWGISEWFPERPLYSGAQGLKRGIYAVQQKCTHVKALSIRPLMLHAPPWA